MKIKYSAKKDQDIIVKNENSRYSAYIFQSITIYSKRINQDIKTITNWKQKWLQNKISNGLGKRNIQF